MKRTLTTLAAILAMGLMARAQDLRSFTSQDGSKTFEGTLVSYDDATKLVSVRMKDRPNPVSFKLDMLSDGDQEYVKDQAKILLASKWLRLRFERYADKAGDDPNKFVGGYEIAVQNNSPDAMEDIQIEYLIVYRKGGMGTTTELKTERGSQSITRLRSGGDDKFQAGKISLQSGASRSMAAGKSQSAAGGKAGCAGST